MSLKQNRKNTFCFKYARQNNAITLQISSQNPGLQYLQ